MMYVRVHIVAIQTYGDGKIGKDFCQITNAVHWFSI